MAATLSELDWSHWMSRWDSQQSGYVPEREARFQAMFDVVAGLLPDAFVALDLACGPGSLSRRLLERFPGARAVAADMDPVMLALGRGALGDHDGRLRWVEVDLASPNWMEAVGETQVDAVLSTTALHWLTAEQLFGVYRDLGGLVRPGGVFLNGDNMEFGPDIPAFRELADRARSAQWTDEAFAARGMETSEQWWAALGAEPAMAPLLAERTRRFAEKTRPDAAIFDVHVAALRDAGFRQVGTVWQVLTDRVLLAVR